MNTPARAAIRKLGSIDAQLAELAQMTVPELAAKYLDLYGEPTRSRNKDYLRKRLSWRVQELAEGGLSKRALTLINALGDELPENWRRRMAEPLPPPTAPRDARLPPHGTTLSRVYRGTHYQATVCDNGVEYKGKRDRSLSAVARAITGTAWNGFAFFGIAQDSRGDENG